MVATMHLNAARPALVALVALSLLLVLGACSPTSPTPPPTSLPASGTPAPSVAQVASPSPSASPDPLPSPSPSASASVAASLAPEPSDPGATLDPGADYAPLDGVLAVAGKRDRLPVAVMVDDNVQARPQYGFNSASIVYQAPADGGESRYMMVFQEQEAKRVEPVRSGRPYFVNWASEYRSAFAHYGGDAKTLAYLPLIDDEYIYDIDAMYGSAPAFHRDTSRVAPHNAVTSSSAVRRRAGREYDQTTMVDGLGVRPFSDDLPAAKRPTTGSIRIPYNRGATSYTYDAAGNEYLRSVSGKRQIDAATGKQVTARNVIVQWVKVSVDPESEAHHNRPLLGHIGSGKALVFRDGHVIKATWQKLGRHTLTRFYDADGKEISLVRGRIFIQVVPTGAKVTYKAQAAG